MHLRPLDEQVVVVMGASSGIGREAALRFARRGAKVVVAARGKQGLESLADEICRMGGEASHIVTDVSDLKQVQAAANFAVEKYSHLDTWAHVAGVGVYATFEQTTPEEFERVIQVNLMGQVYGAMAALPHLRMAGRGALIHTTSVESRRAFPYHSAYAASKHGVKGFLETLRVELAKDGVPISVTEIIPASINTPFFSKARTRLGVEPAPVPPVYSPSTAADAIVYAAEHPVREVVVGGAGIGLMAGEYLSPGLMDRVIRAAGFALQRSNKPKAVDAPNNLFGPVAGDDRVDGDYHPAMPSFYTWLDTHRGLRQVGTAALAVGLMAALASRVLKNTRT